MLTEQERKMFMVSEEDYLLGKDLEGPNEKLMPCPFCGSSDVILANTHTASYWVECQSCEANAKGISYQGNHVDAPRECYEMAARSAIEKWNMRYMFVEG